METSNKIAETKVAKITKSIWGDTWQVDEIIGSTLCVTNHDSLDDAIAYCNANNLYAKIELY